MKPVTVGRYAYHDNAGTPASPVPSDHVSRDWLGWVETKDWIVWESVDGDLFVYNGREPSGAVRGGADGPVVVKREVA